MFLQKAIERARALGRDFVWLCVWEKNEIAIRFYEKNGFEIIGKFTFSLLVEETTEFLMKLDLNH